MDDSAIAVYAHHREHGEGAIEHRREVDVDHLGEAAGARLAQ
jgi:hypothetical protein